MEQIEEIKQHFLIKIDPVANPKAVVVSGSARFTILTPRLLRMEWSPVALFEDRASQAFWFRNQECPEFTVQRIAGTLQLETEYLKLSYTEGQSFSENSLSVDLKNVKSTWRFGNKDTQNLGGTARTLDGVDGPTPLEPGLISRSGWSLVDDSHSLVFNHSSWLVSREAPDGQLDLYFFGHGHDYLACLRDFNLVAGQVPMIPRYVLGNWWSRYWKFTQEELSGLMDDFEKYQVPLSVCIIDMDWHVTKTGNSSSGWTGYTWNRDLFPDPDGFLNLLHEKNLKAALNLHPADGIHPHEEDYVEMSTAVGIDPASQQPVEFDITNPRFVNAYFEILHHPQEKRGIDFWWMDWQQGVKTRLSGLDPLWWLNHLHFLDLGRDGNRRSFIFSRWGGLGNHRYPIGFSGDSIITWSSLAFQPYFTATASNVNYGWWSHDIGGHMGGVQDAELYSRWVQMGVFQPVLRLHSTNNEFLERRPWGYDAETLEITRHAMQLRHSLIPYLYSMAWRYHQDSFPPIVPMYYEYPQQEDAYVCPNQYMFGNQLLVAFFTQPHDKDTCLSRTTAWLPEGDWYDYFTGWHYPSGWHAIYGGLREMPVFARAGAIVPTGPMVGVGGVGTPTRLIVNIFAGGNGSFDLYEDEGNTNFYKQGAFVITAMRQVWNGNQTTFILGPARGELDLLPAVRSLALNFRGFNNPDEVIVKINGQLLNVDRSYDSDTFTVCLDDLQLTPADELEVKLIRVSGSLANFADHRKAMVLQMIRFFKMENNTKRDLSMAVSEILSNPSILGGFLSSLSNNQVLALFEVICQAGLDVTNSTGRELVTFWNRMGDKQVAYLASVEQVFYRWRNSLQPPTEGGVCPQTKSFRPDVDFGDTNPWTVQVSYYGVCLNKYHHPG